MEGRIARLKTSQEARALAANAHRLGHPDVEALANERARELRALEEGYASPAERAIAVALYAYEEHQSQKTGRTFRANRTRQMFANHGVLAAAERMVLNKKPSTGYEVLEDAGLHELSFESIMDRFPEEFSIAALEAARARLEGRPPPPAASARSSAAPKSAGATEIVPSAPFLDAEALAFIEGAQNPDTWFQLGWLPNYRKTVRGIEAALAEGRLEELLVTLWKTRDNSISNAGQGLLSYATVDSLHEELVQVIRDIAEDGSPANFDRIVARFEGWYSDDRIAMVPRLLIARAFAGIHPERYHTTVDADSQAGVLRWFADHTGFDPPGSASWASRAEALVSHLDRIGAFAGDNLARNIFPWFVVDQLRARNAPGEIKAGHSPRPESTYAEFSPERRLVALRHNAVQTALFAILSEEYGADSVWTELPTGTGGQADAVARRPDGSCHLYEIKIAPTAAAVVRQAMGQLLEYGFRRGGLEPMKLVVVGEPALDEVTRCFLARLGSDFNLDIDYLQVELSPSAVAG